MHLDQLYHIYCTTPLRVSLVYGSWFFILWSKNSYMLGYFCLPVLEEHLLPKCLLNSFFFEHFSFVVVALLGEGCLHRDAQLAMKLSRLLR
jgi:hypothetical protein